MSSEINSDKNRNRLHNLDADRDLACEQEQYFDKITDLVFHLLDAPIILIGVVDQERQWVKTGSNMVLASAPRESSLCTSSLSPGRDLFVSDTRDHTLFKTNPLVQTEPGIRSYAGSALISETGEHIGTLAAIDIKPREFAQREQAILNMIAKLVSAHLDLGFVSEKAFESNKRLVDAMDYLPDGLVFYDKDDRLVFCNQRYKEIYAESAHLIVPGALFEDIIRGGVEQGQYPKAQGREKDFIQERVAMHQNPGTPVEQELPGDRWLRIQEGRTSDGGIIGFRFDITTLKRQERELTRIAWTDSLTGVLSRSRFLDLSEIEYKSALRHDDGMAILILDIDHFKWINDTYGHAAGDHVLIEIARRWKKVLRSNDLIGRLGGEEFGILIADAQRDTIFEIAERIRSTTETENVTYENKEISVTVSIGISMISKGYDDFDEMMLVADKALYEVKRNGRNGYQISAA